MYLNGSITYFVDSYNKEYEPDSRIITRGGQEREVAGE